MSDHENTRRRTVHTVAPEVGDCALVVNDKKRPQLLVARTPGYEFSLSLKPGQRLSIRRLSDAGGELQITLEDEPQPEADHDAPVRRPPYLRLIRS